MSTRYSDLSCTYEVKSEDDKAATFTGVASTSDIDHHGDIVAAGAFDPIAMKMAPDGKAIPDVMMLRDHDRSEIIGGWRSFRQEGRQLKVEGELCLDVNKARETHSLMKRGYLSGISVGFQIQSLKDIEYDEKTNKRTIKRATLKECSIVAFPANSRARVHNVKSLFDEFLSERDDLASSNELLLAHLARMEERILEALSKQGNGKSPPEPKANESRENYIGRCMSATGGDVAACNAAWAKANKSDDFTSALLKGIDGFRPIDESKVVADLGGLLAKMKGRGK